MKQYWPNKEGIELNHEVANLFILTKQKLLNNLSNISSYYLYIDILDNQTKYQFFNIALEELEILILDIIELNLTIKDIKKINYKLLYNLVEKNIKNIIKHINIKNVQNIIKPFQYNYHKIISIEHKLLLENLIIYLIFGSAQIKNNLFIFNNYYTPKAHVSILLENFIIQLSNITFFCLFQSINSLSQLIEFLNINKLCNNNYISTRSIALFKNKLIWQNFIYLYINQPKIIYNSRYQVWLISTNGLITKYIYASRIEDFTKLTKNKLIFIILIEIQDLLIPKIEQLILILSKLTLFIIINILGNSTIFVVRTISYYIRKKDIKL